MTERKTTAKAEADPCGMKARNARAKATTTAKEKADPCGMTARNARAKARARAAKA
jgi:hypothetical protein